MIITIRFTEIPEDIAFDVACRKDYADAVGEAWQSVRSEAESLQCYVPCPEQMPIDWAIVPGLVVPPYWGNLAVIYRQWPLVVDYARSLLGAGGGVSRIYEEKSNS